ncbi:M15 family metallopeptidase [Solitalea sp. MAHUQ-68]|uniref:D-alanyl-D-alanine dipeptidase n=1 Tax=Solitalea agri TaxID=2953739 RepID=A0A9X2F189_9SPHI|nr:M15 family metallopeptidase [Solitalea agri]MCO4292817.1 M15 family metallopeptidase [Solitalea agri]
MTKEFFALPLIALFFSGPGFCQDVPQNKYGLKVVANIGLYQQQVNNDSAKALIEIQKEIPNIALDIRYASTNNFMHEKMYNLAKAYTRLPVLSALKNVQKELNEKGLGLKIFDAYRPYTITVAFYEKQKDSIFVATPWKGSRHNRGCAIDLTIINLKNGKELEMPTPFDDFTEKANTDYPHLPKKVIENRQLLKDIMTKNGFTAYKDEWWHFDFNGWKEFDVTDISFEDLQRLQTLN